MSRLPDLPIKVIPSEEVKTSEGEIIGYFLTELVPKGLSPEETVKRIKGQGGLVAVPHPFDSLRTGSRIQTPALERLVEAGLVDILEVLNARSIDPEDNRKALELRPEARPAHVGRLRRAHPYGSGPRLRRSAALRRAQQFLAALRKGNSRRHRSSKLIHITSTWAKVA